MVSRNARGQLARKFNHLFGLTDINERQDFFIQYFISDEIERFKKDKGYLDRFILVYRENLLRFNYIKDLKKFITGEK